MTVLLVWLVLMMNLVEAKVDKRYHWQCCNLEKRTLDCDWIDFNSPISQCALRGSEWHFSDYGQNCYDAFDPAARTIRNVCPLSCQSSDEYAVLAKLPSNNHRCSQHFNYGIERENGDVVLWRSGRCLNETIKFTIRCGFPLSAEEMSAGTGLFHIRV